MSDTNPPERRVLEESNTIPDEYVPLKLILMACCTIAVILSATLFLSMTVPLLYPSKRKKYSTYNLYLASIALPDLIFSAYIVGVFVVWDGMANERIKPDQPKWISSHMLGDAISDMCMPMNLFINMFVVYEIYVLLLRSSRLRRAHPPTIFKVFLQTLVAYSGGILAFVTMYLMKKEKKDKIIALVFCFIPPVSFLVSITFAIWYKGLIGSTETMYDGRLKILVLYYLRIIIVGFLWVPVFICLMISFHIEEKEGKTTTDQNMIVGLHFTATLLAPIQAVSTFAFSFKNPQPRQYILDLVTFEYCRSFSSSNQQPSDANTHQTPGNKPWWPKKCTGATRLPSKPQSVTAADDEESRVVGMVATTLSSQPRSECNRIERHHEKKSRRTKINVTRSSIFLKGDCFLKDDDRIIIDSDSDSDSDREEVSL